MKEIREILDQISGLEIGEKAVLATVVDLKGSGYRLPGARMLIRANGDAVGTVSGGCLEADVMERAKRVLKSGLAEVFTYDTTADENSVFSLNMGCRGVMRILLEAVDGTSEIIAALRSVRTTRQPTASAVLIAIQGPSRLAIGSRIFLSNSGPTDPIDTCGLCLPFPTLCEDLYTFSGSSSYETIRYETADGVVEFAFESLKPSVRLLIFGAGADAVPLADAAYALGWQTAVCDHRPAFLNRERFAAADELLMAARDSTPQFTSDKLTAIVLMNHNYDRDKALLPQALRSHAFYVGALGPKKRTSQILDELNAAGESFSGVELARLRSPAGLDIGADTPEAIAISMIAEIQSVFRKRSGGPLRDRQAPIYDRKT
ncbi:MAG: XdhC/CoxI family protein [Pseudomonadota bacterium]